MTDTDSEPAAEETPEQEENGGHLGGMLQEKVRRVENAVEAAGREAEMSQEVVGVVQEELVNAG